MKYRKKPVIINAEQYDGEGAHHLFPEGLCRAVLGECTFSDREWAAHIHTLEGTMHVQKGDWIIKGVKGEFYPCKPDIFEMTYEPVEE